jgi:hypothetical protein
MVNANTNIRHKTGKKNSLSLYTSLDTLGQLDNSLYYQGFQRSKDTKKKPLDYRALAVYRSKALAKKLMCLDSPLKKAYKRTFYDCCQTMVQEGHKLQTKRCRSRWCISCNHARQGKIYRQYGHVLDNMVNPYMVTLTIRNVSGNELRSKIEGMKSTFVNISRSIKAMKMPFNCIRSIECTHNAIANTFHPHFHVVIEGKETAELLRNKWLKYYPLDTDIKAQDIRPATSLIELIKYVTKLYDIEQPEKINVGALDTIFNAISNTRIFQAYGNIKAINDDINETEVIENADIPFKEFAVWRWHTYDWYDMVTGEKLTNFVPDDTETERMET